MPQIDPEQLPTFGAAEGTRSSANFLGEVTEINESFTDEYESMVELQKNLQTVTRTAVVFNPFRAQNNLCSGGTYGDSGIATLEQFVPYVLMLRKVPRITPKRPDENSVLLGDVVIGSDVALVNRTAQEMSETLLKIHGAVGVSRLDSLAASDFKQIGNRLLIYEIVMQGWNKQGLLEDLPEYFGARSPHLPYKYDAVPGTGRENSFTMTAEEVLQIAATEGVILKKLYGKELLKFDPKIEKFLTQECVLNAREVEIGKQLIVELRNSALKMHEYAVGAEGVLPKTKEHLESVKRGPTFGKQKYDDLDRYLMLHFPSYPMDTEIEKSERNQRRGMEAIFRNMPNNAANNNDEELRLLRERNKLLEEQNSLINQRLDSLEKSQKT